MKNIPISATPLMVAVVALIGVGYVTWFLWSGIVSKRAEIESRSAEVARVTLQEDRLFSVRAALRDTEGLRAELDQYLVYEDTLPDFFSLLEESGRVAGATVIIRDAQVEQGGDGRTSSVLERLRFELVAEGSFLSLTHFIGIIESLPYDVQMSSVRLERGGEGEAGGVWNVALTATVAKVKG